MATEAVGLFFLPFSQIETILKLLSLPISPGRTNLIFDTVTSDFT